MNPAIPITAVGIALAAVIFYACRLALNAAARRLEQLLADALDRDWLPDLDDEHRRLIEEGA